MSNEMTPPSTARQQVRNNWVALASLAIALFGLGYNTWRNETTERHRNVREASFMVLTALAELQQLSDARFFGKDNSDANRIAIWGRVGLVRDMAGLVSPEAQVRAESLHAAWATHAPAFDAGSVDAETAFAQATRSTRKQVLEDLGGLR